MSGGIIDGLYIVTSREQERFFCAVDPYAAQPDAVDMPYLTDAPGNGRGIRAWRPVQCQDCRGGISWLPHGVADGQQPMVLRVIVHDADGVACGKFKCHAYPVRRPGGMRGTSRAGKRNHLH